MTSAQLRPSPPCAAPAPELLAQRAIRAEAIELGRQRLHVADREEQPPLAVADQLAVELEVGDDRDGAGRERLADQGGRHPYPAGGEADDVGTGDELRRLPIGRPNNAQPLAQPPADAGEGIGRALEPDHPLPVELLGKLAQGPEQQAQRPALLQGAMDDPDPPLRRRRQGRLGDIGAGTDQLVGAREEALQQLAGRLVARGAGVYPPEEDLDQHPRHLGGEHPLGRLVKGGDVERLRVA